MATKKNYTVQLASVLGWAAVFSHHIPVFPPQREICTTNCQLNFFSTEKNNKRANCTHILYSNVTKSPFLETVGFFSFLPAIKLLHSSPCKIIAEIWFGKVCGNIFRVLNLINFDLIINPIRCPIFAVCLYHICSCPSWQIFHLSWRLKKNYIIFTFMLFKSKFLKLQRQYFSVIMQKEKAVQTFKIKSNIHYPGFTFQNRNCLCRAKSKIQAN